MVHRPGMPASAFLRLLTGLLLAGAAHAAEAPEVRFSQTLPAADAAASGLPRLSSDEVAVIDALVRRDTAARLATSSPTTPAAFSQRLTADERRTAGLTRLAPTELARLDEFVERQQNARLARALLAPPVFLSRSIAAEPRETKGGRAVHGTFSLSYGFGRGYSERSGAMTWTVEDPARGYAVTVGYAETHVKGANVSVLRPDPDGLPAGVTRPTPPLNPAP
jgi:hypothetical protein